MSDDVKAAEFYHPARILGPDRLTGRAPEAELLSVLRDRFDLGEDETPFFFPAEISSTRLDAYFTHMMESTLRNFAEDAAAGVSLLDSHDARKLGFGYSLTGMYEAGGETKRTVADFYTIAGIRFGGQHSYASTDDFIRAVRAGIARDVSVGFYGGTWICDICGGDARYWSECPHILGMQYPIGEQGEAMVTATAGIDGANLAETSIVYDGATPGAMVLKINQMADAGELEPDAARVIETAYRIKLPQVHRVWPGAKTKETGGDMSGKDLRVPPSPPTPLPEGEGGAGEKATPAEMPTEVLTILAARNVEPTTAGLYEVVRTLAAENSRLSTLADMGRQYRDDLVEAAISEGVRAMGESFPQEAYRDLLSKSTLEQIKALRDSFAADARKRFPGGRRTTDGEQPETDGDEGDEAPTLIEPEIPAAAFSGS